MNSYLNTNTCMKIYANKNRVLRGLDYARISKL